MKKIVMMMLAVTLAVNVMADNVNFRNEPRKAARFRLTKAAMKMAKTGEIAAQKRTVATTRE